MPARRKSFVRRRTTSKGRYVRKTRATKSPRRKVYRKRVFKKRSSGIARARGASVKAGNSAENVFPNVKAKPDPSWWKTVKKEQVPHSFVGYGDSIMTSAIGFKECYTHYLHKDPYSLSGLLAYFNVESKGDAPEDSSKQYMFNYVREHEWRNATNGTAEVEAYVLYPRRDLPIWTQEQLGATLQAMPQWCPYNRLLSSSNTLLSPTGFTQDFLDRNQAGTVSKITYHDLAVTPYMSPTTCSQFKIKPLSLQWPNGQKGYKGLLEAGQTLKLVSRSPRPMMVSYSKYCLNGQAENTVESTWQILKGMPLLMIFIRGTNVHDATTNTSINIGASRLDYTTTIKFGAITTQAFKSVTSRFTNQMNSVTTPEQVVPVLGANTTMLP